MLSSPHVAGATGPMCSTSPLCGVCCASHSSLTMQCWSIGLPMVHDLLYFSPSQELELFGLQVYDRIYILFPSYIFFA